MHIEKDLVAAMATPLVLGILADGESYGYAIAKRVRELSDGKLEWTDGMLYPLLHRLERQGYVSATWGTASSGRRRKHYALSDAGHRALAEHRRQWAVADSVLGRVWGPPSLRLAVTGSPVNEGAGA